MAQPLVADSPALPKPLRDVLIKARTSWLKNTEVVDILQNYKSYHFRVCRDPPNRPAGGTLFLFNRTAVRFFRKDGHNWRKKADGKTVRETHEKLKLGNRDMLNCYYAHSEVKEALQRRCYWLLDGDDNTVLVHYLSSSPGLRAVQSSAAPQMRSDGSFRFRDPQVVARIGGALMARATSAPDNLTEKGELQTVQFVVTTGESHLTAEGEAEEEVPRGKGTGAVFSHEPYQGHLIDARLSPTWTGSAAEEHYQQEVEEDTRKQQELSRAASTPVLPSDSQRPMHQMPTNAFDFHQMLGPLHSAPSFSAGTVQTGSTLDRAALQQLQIQLTKADSYQSSLSDASDLPYPSGSRPQRTASENLGLARSAKRQRDVAFGTAMAEETGMLRRDSEPTEMHYELKPAMSLTRMDSDTLQNAPTLSRATSGPASMRCSSVPGPVTSAPGCLPLPSTYASPFYAAAFAGLPRPEEEESNRRPLSFCHLINRGEQGGGLGDTDENHHSTGLPSHLRSRAEATAASSCDSRHIDRRLSSPFGTGRMEPVELSDLRPAGQPGAAQPGTASGAELAMDSLVPPPLNWLIASGRMREMSAGFPASTWVGPPAAPGPQEPLLVPRRGHVLSRQNHVMSHSASDPLPPITLPDLEPVAVHMDSPMGLNLPMDSWEFSFHGMT